MNDIMSMLSALERPQLLVQAARHGLADYSRDRVLKRILKDVPRSPRRVVIRLLDEEAAMEAARTDGMAHYSAGRHIEVLVALMSEARMIWNTQQPTLAAVGD